MSHFTTPNTSSSFTQSQFEQHIAQLKTKLPSSDFSIVVQPPFVVVGDEPAQVVKQHSEETIKWAVDKLKQDFFQRILRTFSTSGYSKMPPLTKAHANNLQRQAINSLRLLFARPQSANHEYRNRRRNPGSWIVHPFVEANFAACPSWLNEGLGSLYEQCGEKDGHIHGYVNWRLPGLQQAIKAGTVPDFKTLTALDTNAFYADGRGVNYAQSRYLCYYLQERGLLVKFYQLFYAQQKNDPTGYKSLTSILGNPDMDTVQEGLGKVRVDLKRLVNKFTSSGTPTSESTTTRQRSTPAMSKVKLVFDFLISTLVVPGKAAPEGAAGSGSRQLSSKAICAESGCAFHPAPGRFFVFSSFRQQSLQLRLPPFCDCLLLIETLQRVINNVSALNGKSDCFEEPDRRFRHPFPLPLLYLVK